MRTRPIAPTGAQRKRCDVKPGWSSCLWVLTACIAACGGGEPVSSRAPTQVEATPSTGAVAVSPAGEPGAVGTAAEVAVAAVAVTAVTAAAASAATATAATAAPAARGVLLQGMPGQSAMAVLLDFTDKEYATAVRAARASPQSPQSPATSVTSAAPTSALLYAVIGEQATVGQVNAALAAQQARILDMSYSSATVTIEVPLGNSNPALADVNARLMASKAFSEVGVRKISRYTPRPNVPVVVPIEDHQSPG